MASFHGSSIAFDGQFSYNLGVKQVWIIFLILFSFISARAAELGCLCFEDTSSHISKTSSDETVKIAEQHHDAEESGAEHSDHCQHTCSQCHFAAVVPLSFALVSQQSSIGLELFTPVQSPQETSFLFYRPPIV